MGYWAKASRFPSLFLGMPFAFNHFGMLSFASSVACAAITEETGLPAFDVLERGADELVEVLEDLRLAVLRKKR